MVDEELNGTISNLLKDNSLGLAFINSWTVETFFRPHGITVLKKVLSHVIDCTGIVFTINGDLHWSVVLAVRMDTWCLYHVDSAETSSGDGLHNKRAEHLTKLLLESKLFGDKILLQPSWGHVLQKYEWECGHYAIAAVETFIKSCGCTEGFSVNDFFDTLGITFQDLYNRIDASVPKRPSHGN
ncbi:MAG: hypothetical protein AB7P49_00675 [Bdellovibrionales bacterium]